MFTNPTTTEIDLCGWLRQVSSAQPVLAELLGCPEAAQRAAGYFHTLREICQQPLLWPDAAERVEAARAELEARLEDSRTVTLTGSGSSQYAAECVAPVLESELARPVRAVGGGWLLTSGHCGLGPLRPATLVSLARSGDSPESTAGVGLYLGDPDVGHIIITCNPAGCLAARHRGHERATVVTLDERTNDHSLVMTSSFSSLVVAARGLALLDQPGCHRAIASALADAARTLLLGAVGTIESVARSDFERVVYLGDGCRFGAAREAALKMLEMTEGRVATMPETFLGLRHGPMALIDPRTLVVCFLSSTPMVRAYQCDLIAEVSRKQLGARKLLFGEDIPGELAAEGDVVVECPGMAALGDANVPVLDVLIGQWLAFFRCRAEGLSPDSPSTSGVISRVVESFPVHPR